MTGLLFVFAAAAFLVQPGAAPAQEGPVVVAVSANVGPWFYVQTFEPTMERLRARMPRVHFQSVELSPEALRREAREGRIDFFMAPSGSFASIEEESGARHLATHHPRGASDPARSMGSVFLVRADSALRKLSDLKGTRSVATDPESFDGWIIAQGELFSAGFDPQKFFRSTEFTGYGLPDVPALLLSRDADVGILKACDFEMMTQAGIISGRDFRILNEKPAGSFACRVSTDLYPGVVFASLPRAPSDLVKSVSVALLTMPETPDGNSWGFASDFSQVRNLYRNLQIGPYAYLRENSPLALLKRYRFFLFAAVALLALALFYVVSVRRIVKIRTHALQVALKEKDRAQENERKSRERLFALEKAGVVSGLSSMFAHEVRQPVASLINYAGGLRMYLKGRSGDPMVAEALDEITAQSERVSAIVGRVCSYARNEARIRKLKDLEAVVDKALEAFSHSSFSSGVRIERQRRGPALCCMDLLEIELLVVNLLRNAGAAIQKSGSPVIALALSAEDGFWKLSVTDNGPPLSDETLKSLAAPTRSSRKDGLGLGLSICRVIAEGHGGHLSFRRASPHGLTALLYLPQPEEACKE
ncbi:sensor histidine kinase [Mesosutterella sp. OilRF-GAM-744-9]|uniref:histidine kinase n=1 Tax=Mesosutterella porci TaxID=2915351 RepID=A0ABS9MSF6_9BURK|nr:sensor histidine kinase [Mesosutterella sp. oilRF-744-WT-GAM-9]MCG5031563.1 sensor histidine kinase [Mesosutterella sp. oilRF-744-WT-GAM-9]